MIAPDFVRRIVTMYLTPSASPYRPEVAAWQAKCPRCGSESAWASARIITGLRYEIDCPACGEVSWVA